MSSLALWRRRFETTLAEEYGWLSLAGLFWFDQGTATLGTSEDNDFVLDPDPLLPARVGTLEFAPGRLMFTPAPGIPVTLDGREVTGPTRLNFEDEANPSVVEVGALRLYPIHSGPRFGLRARNPHTVYRRTFAGLNWLPENPSLRIVAQFHRWDEPKPLAVANVLGDAEPTVSLGEIRFSLEGQDFRFLAEPGREGGFFVNFKDGSTGKTTYPGGRFLYTPAPEGDTVVVDFNQAHSPPCSRTPYAVCPRPPLPNRVPFALGAGELYPHVSGEFRR